MTENQAQLPLRAKAPLSLRAKRSNLRESRGISLWRGPRGTPQLHKSPMIGGYRGLIKKSPCVIASEAKQSKGVQRDFPLVGVWGYPPTDTNGHRQKCRFWLYSYDTSRASINIDSLILARTFHPYASLISSGPSRLLVLSSEVDESFRFGRNSATIRAIPKTPAST